MTNILLTAAVEHKRLVQNVTNMLFPFHLVFTP